MKKVFNICIALFICFCMTGCGKKLKLDELSTTLEDLTEDKFAILNVVENVEYADNLLGSLSDVSEYDLDKLKINSDNINRMVFRVDENELPVYIVIEYVEGKKEEVQNDINNYIKDLKLENKFETEYEGNLIYIFSDKKDEILKRIKESKAKVFGMIMNVDSEYLENMTGISSDLLDEFLVKNSVITQADGIFILKPKKGKKEEVKELMSEYLDMIEKQWSTYLPDQYELVKNRLETEYGDYLIYIISRNNDLVLKTIKEYKK